MKLINDTLKTNGKWSAKRVTALASFIMACSLPLYALYRNEVSSEIIMLAGEFLTSSLVCLGISSWQKTKIVESQKEELPPEV